MNDDILAVETAWGYEWLSDALCDDLLDDLSLKVERTEAFFGIARKLSDYIRNLPLSVEQNDQLIKLMVDQVCEAENGAFRQGLKMGKEFTEHEMKGDS